MILIRLFFAILLGAAVPCGGGLSAQTGATDTADQDTHFRSVLDAIRRNFPDDYRRIATAYSQPGGDRIAGQMIRQLYDSHVQDIGRAPAADLLAIVSAERDYILALKRHSPSICAIYGERADVSSEGLPLDAVAAGLKMGLLKWDSARAGIEHPVNRPLERAAPEDARALAEAMQAAGATDRDIGLLNGTAPVEAATADNLCDAHIMGISSILFMDPEAGGNIAAIRYAGH